MATIGQFMQPRNHSDVVDPKAVTPPPTLSVPATIPFEPAPVLSTPMAVTTEANPLPPAPSGPSPLPAMAAPTLSVPSVIPFEDPPVLSSPAVMPFQNAPALSSTSSLLFQDPPPLTAISGVALPPASTPNPAFWSDLVPQDTVEDPPRLTNPADLQEADQKAGRALPGDETCRAMVEDRPKHSDLVAANTSAPAGFVEKEFQGLINDVKGLLTNIDIHNQAVVTIPGVGPLPLDLDINTHGGKLNVGVDLHLRQAGVTAAQAGITYGKSKAQAAINSATRAVISGFGASHTSVTPSGFLGDKGLQKPGNTPADAIPTPSTGDPATPASSPGAFHLTGLEVEAVNPEIPYNKDARNEAQSVQQQAAGKSRELIGKFNKYNDASYTESVLGGVKSAAAVSYLSRKNAVKTVTGADIDLTTENRYFDTAGQTEKTSAENTPANADLRYLNDLARDSTTTKKNSLKDLWINPQGSTTGLEFKPTPLPTINVKNDPLVKAAEDQSAKISTTTGAEETFGFFAANANASEYSKTTPSDDDSYVPLVFTDLRPIRGGTYRSVYFRPFIKSLTENFSPHWNMQTYFNRVDKVATYQSTDRVINLTFKIVSFSPDDLQTNYQKLQWLTSMVYPQYEPGASLRYFAGPVIKLRVGDIINSVGKDGLKGLPGVITSLNFTYDDATWELLPNRKLPKNVDVTIGFHVLHEFAIGTVRGSDSPFGGVMNGGGPVGNEKTSQVSVSRFRASFGNDYLNNPKTNGGVS